MAADWSRRKSPPGPTCKTGIFAPNWVPDPVLFPRLHSQCKDVRCVDKVIAQCMPVLADPGQTLGIQQLMQSIEESLPEEVCSPSSPVNNPGKLRKAMEQASKALSKARAALAKANENKDYHEKQVVKLQEEVDTGSKAVETSLLLFQETSKSYSVACKRHTEAVVDPASRPHKRSRRVDQLEKALDCLQNRGHSALHATFSPTKQFNMFEDDEFDHMELDGDDSEAAAEARRGCEQAAANLRDKLSHYQQVRTRLQDDFCDEFADGLKATTEPSTPRRLAMGEGAATPRAPRGPAAHGEADSAAGSPPRRSGLNSPVLLPWQSPAPLATPAPPHFPEVPVLPRTLERGSSDEQAVIEGRAANIVGSGCPYAASREEGIRAASSSRSGPYGP